MVSSFFSRKKKDPPANDGANNGIVVIEDGRKKNDNSPPPQQPGGKRKRGNNPVIVMLLVMLAVLACFEILLSTSLGSSVMMISESDALSSLFSRVLPGYNCRLVESNSVSSGEALVRQMTPPWKVKATTAAARIFLLQEPGQATMATGLRLSKRQLQVQDKIKTHLIRHLCFFEDLTRNSQVIKAGGCKREFTMHQCHGCGGRDDDDEPSTTTGVEEKKTIDAEDDDDEEGVWYSGVAHAGATSILFDSVDGNPMGLYNDAAAEASPWKHETWRIDIGIPATSDDDLAVLQSFVARLGNNCLQKLAWWHKDRKLSVRLLITAATVDAKKESELKTQLAKSAGLLGGAEAVEFVKTPAKNSRAQSLNTLHKQACIKDAVVGGQSCVFVIMDPALEPTPTFLRSVLAYVQPGVSAYMPIVWSDYAAQGVQLATVFDSNHANLTGVKQRFASYRGTWLSQRSSLAYAMAGSDANQLEYNEGKADTIAPATQDANFVQRVLKQGLHVIRQPEAGLVYNHGNSAASEPQCSRQEILSSGGTITPHPYCLDASSRSSRHSLTLELEQMLHNQTERLDALVHPHRESLVIIVLTTRKNFASRASAIVRTWGTVCREHNIPVWFVMGGGGSSAAADDDDLVKFKTIVKANEQKGAAFPLVEVLSLEVDDAESPPVRKVAAIFEHVARHATMHARGFDWILKVDDDTYVNAAALHQFLTKRVNSTTPHYQAWGHRQVGPRGIAEEDQLFTKPFCMAGPGFVMNWNTWHLTASGMADCVAHVDQYKYRDALWHDDLIVFMCLTKLTQGEVGCWDRLDDQEDHSKLFVQDYSKGVLDHLIHDKILQNAITFHPLRDGADLQKLHDRVEQHVKKQRIKW